MEPDILLMDEPTSALDPISTLKVEDLMQELKQKSTSGHRHPQHAAGRPRRGQDRLFLLGELVEFDGHRTQLFSMPRDKRTEDYITGRFG